MDFRSYRDMYDSMNKTDAEVRRTLLESLASVPHASGMNNHQGSKATEDRRVMSAVVAALREQNYFYLDSMTSQDSVGWQVAGEAGLPALKRDVFLDNERTPEAVTAQLDLLRRIALERGQAIGIGHDEPVTLNAIKAYLGEFEKDGIELVKLSDLLDE